MMEFDERELRIRKQEETGMVLSKFDRMKEDTTAFWKLNDV